MTKIKISRRWCHYYRIVCLVKYQNPEGGDTIIDLNDSAIRRTPKAVTLL